MLIQLNENINIMFLLLLTIILNLNINIYKYREGICDDKCKRIKKKKKQKKQEEQEAEEAAAAQLQATADYSTDYDENAEYVPTEEDDPNAEPIPSTLDFPRTELKSNNDRKQAGPITRVFNRIVATMLRNIVKIIPFKPIREMYLNEIKANKNDSGKMLIGFILVTGTFILLIIALPHLLMFMMGIITSVIIWTFGSIFSLILWAFGFMGI